MVVEFVVNFVGFIALAIALIVSMLTRSYLREKGKNFATKEDIELIARKIEGVKFLYKERLMASEAFYGRKIEAFDELRGFIFDVQSYCFRASQESEHAVPYDEIPSKSGFQRAMGLSELTSKHELFISTQAKIYLDDLSQSLFMMGHMELAASSCPDLLQIDLYRQIEMRCKEVLALVQEEFFLDTAG